MVEPTKFRRADVGTSGRRIACGRMGGQFSPGRGAGGTNFNKTASDERGSGVLDPAAVSNCYGASGASIVTVAQCCGVTRVRNVCGYTNVWRIPRCG